MQLAHLARGFIRNYMFGCTRVGRSKFKKLFRTFLPPQARIQLAPEWVMDLDLKSSNQEFIFWFHEELESSLQWAIKNFVKEGSVFIDCGANAGFMGFSALHAGAAQVLFIEPHPRLANSIRHNVELNHLEARARVLQCAASHSNGHATFHFDGRSDGGHSLLPQKTGSSAGEVQVEVHRLDTLLKESGLTQIDFLKIDTEGHDAQVLQSLGAWLNPLTIKLLFVEMDGDYDASWRLLTERGYRPFCSEMIYIDELRRLSQKGEMPRFFEALDKPGEGNLLWCARGSNEEEALLRQFPVLS